MWNNIREYFGNFNVLRACPQRYWGAQIVNVFHMAMYFGLLTVVTIFLSKEMGMSDEKAGYVYSGLGISGSLALMLSGSVTDWLGVRRSLYISLWGKMACVAGICWAAFDTTMLYREEVSIGSLWALGVFFAMLQTCFQTANKRFTTTSSRSAGFSLWYLFMNLGAMAGGLYVDLFRKVLELSTTWVILAGGLTSIPCLLVVVFMIRNDEQAYDVDEEPEAPQPKETPWAILWQVLTNKVFWKLVALITLILGTRAIFLYTSVLMPKYWERVIGEGAPIGIFNSINPFLIVVGIILFVPIANKINVFKGLTYGAIVSGASLLAMAIPRDWLPMDTITSYYVTTVITMVVLSIGEVFWSPRLMEYTAAIAPEGQEGAYLGISMMTWFVAKTVVSTLSGHMLTKWCPEGIGESIAAGTLTYWETPEAMWLILSLIAVGGVLVIMAAKKFFVGGTALDDNYEEATA